MTEGGLGRQVALGAATICALAVLCAGAAGAGIASIFGGGSPPSATATSAIPAVMLTLYQQAATTCPGLPWTILAAIGTVETDNDTSTLPGVHSGANSAGAEVIYRWDGGLWHQRDEAIDGRGSLVSEGSLARGQGGGHSGFIGSPTHDDQISSVASGVAI